MKMKQTATIILITICSFGLLVQVTEVTKSYLEYKIRRVILRNFPFTLDPPAISICFNIYYLIPTQVFDVESTSNSSYWKKFYDYMEITPMKELFNLTPKVDELLVADNGCAIRFPSRYAMSFLNRSQCYSHFVIQKYIQRQFMCYKFTPVVELDTSRKFETGYKPGSSNLDQKFGRGWKMEYLMAPVETGVIYALYFNASAFNRARVVVSYAHGPDTEHFEDSFIATQYPMTISHSRGTAIKISFQSLSYHRLPSPYPSNCYKMINGKSMAHRFVDIMNHESMTVFNKSCAVAQLYEDHHYNNYTIITDRNYRNETFLNLFNAIIQRNEKYRDGWTCNLKHFLTAPVTQPIEVINGSDYKFLIYVTWPLTHSIDVIDESLQNILDLLTYIASSLGFWFGFNLFSFAQKGGTGLITFFKTQEQVRNGADSSANSKGEGEIEIHKQINNQRKLIEVLRKECKSNKICNQTLLSQVKRTDLIINHLVKVIPSGQN